MHPLVSDVSKVETLSIVGLEKNTGKTECLNFLLRNLPSDKRVCVTSIGVDGERVDSVTSTSKPEITLPQGCFFATSEMHYRSRHIESEIFDISRERTALGRVVTSKAITGGRVLLSGPSTTSTLGLWLKMVKEKLAIDLTIVDGALSRVSSASPSITKAMILSTGAALSISMDSLVRRTAFEVEMIRLPLWPQTQKVDLCTGAIGMAKEVDLKSAKSIEITGALTDSFLNMLIQRGLASGRRLIIKDFTRVFFKENVYRMFVAAGGSLFQKASAKLLAICVNPTSPQGFLLDSDILCRKLSEKTGVPAYDILKQDYEA